MMSKTQLLDFGFQDYELVWKQQQEMFAAALRLKKQNEKIENKVIFVEHPAVFTLGKSANASNVLLNEELLGAKVFKIERGGDVTFHGPGQLVVYPIIDLEFFNMSLRDYVFNMEEVIINTLKHFHLEGTRLSGASGVWLDVGLPTERKIAALGVKASRHITMHGIAFNINTDLSWFHKINPCGFTDKGVTSLAHELGKKQDFESIRKLVYSEFNKIFT